MKKFDFSRFLEKLSNMLPILVVIAGIFLVYTLFKKGVFGTVGGVLFGEGTKASKTQNELDSSLLDSVPKSVNVISSSDAKRLAERLFKAMDSSGTDENEIDLVYNTLAVRPMALLDVSAAFGIRKYSLTGSPSGLGKAFIWAHRDLDLRGWLTQELSTKAMAKWNLLFNLVGY